MSDMRTANSSILKDPAGIARATDQYATNLRTISAITGEDAKKKMEDARKASANVAFREKMMELEKTSPGIYQKYLEATATMTDQQRQNVQETLVFGSVINETGAIMDASSNALSNLTKTTAQSIQDGTILKMLVLLVLQVWQDNLKMLILLCQI
jgi:formylmethanofuran dehydrogenase subunit E-like metal-binding protein